MRLVHAVRLLFAFASAALLARAQDEDEFAFRDRDFDHEKADSAAVGAPTLAGTGDGGGGGGYADDLAAKRAMFSAVMEAERGELEAEDRYRLSQRRQTKSMFIVLGGVVGVIG